jgi:DNA replication protein DnaC
MEMITTEKARQHPRYNFFIEHDIPMIFICHTLEDYDITWLHRSKKIDENVKNFSAYADYHEDIEDRVSKGIGLFISGNYGVGKTLLAVIMINRYLDVFRLPRQDRVEFVTAETLVRLFGYDLTEKQKLKRDNILEGCRLLVIDDLGKLALTKNAKEIMQVENVVRERYFRMRPTIITSQGDTLSDGIKEILNDRYVCVTLHGESYRNNLNGVDND